MTGAVRRHVKVLDEAGLPVEGAFVAVEESSVPFPEIALVTDIDGGTQLFLPKGRFRICAYGENNRRGSAEAIGGEEGGMEDIEIILTPSEGG